MKKSAKKKACPVGCVKDSAAKHLESLRRVNHEFDAAVKAANAKRDCVRASKAERAWTKSVSKVISKAPQNVREQLVVSASKKADSVRERANDVCKRIEYVKAVNPIRKEFGYSMLQGVKGYFR